MYRYTGVFRTPSGLRKCTLNRQSSLEYRLEKTFETFIFILHPIQFIMTIFGRRKCNRILLYVHVKRFSVKVLFGLTIIVTFLILLIDSIENVKLEIGDFLTTRPVYNSTNSRTNENK